MDIDAFLAEAKKLQFQQYYACYWFCFNLPMGHFGDSNMDYINWITQRHEDFKPMSKYLYTENYYNEFLEYLKTYSQQNKIK